MDDMEDLQQLPNPQEQRLAALEAMVERMSLSMDRLVLLNAPTPSITPQPPPVVRPVPQPASQSLSQAPTRTAKVSPPDMYSGDRHKLHMFLAKCRHNFLSRPELFPNEPQKVLFASGYLDGAAFNWFQPVLNQYAEATVGNSEVPLEFETFTQFAKSLEETFGDPDIVRSKERELGNLHQTTSVASYLAEFSRIKGFVKWNDEALASQFYKGLKSGVKDGLVYENPAPTTLAQLSSAALRIDSRQFERLLERKLESSTPSQSTRGARHPSNSPFAQPQRFINSVTASPAPRPPPAPTPASDGSTPMELDFSQSYPSRFRAPLGNEEKQRRRELNLCLYCASDKHRVSTCPLAPPPKNPPPQRLQVVQAVNSDLLSKDPAQE